MSGTGPGIEWLTPDWLTDVLRRSGDLRRGRGTRSRSHPYPRDGTTVGVHLIDWDNWRVDTATGDLAYMMAVHWYPVRRRQIERRLLAFYHEALVRTGVAGYDFDTLWDDYRVSVVWQLTVPRVAEHTEARAVDLVEPPGTGDARLRRSGLPRATRIATGADRRPADQGAHDARMAS